MVLGYHVILGAYGFWLPNDPRGSWSDLVRSWELYQHGPSTKVSTRRSVANKQHDHTKRLNAKKSLTYPPVQFTGIQARAIARGFANYVDRSGLIVRSCAVLPKHTHLVIARHRLPVEQIINQLKGAATRHIIREGLHPLIKFASTDERPPAMWSHGAWKVFLDTDAAMGRAIRYVEGNPEKEGKRRQNWPFVTAFPSAPLSGRR